MTNRNDWTPGALVALALAGCSQGASDLAAIRLELNTLKQELEYVRMQAEELDPRLRNAEQMALQVMEERAAPVRLDCVERGPGVVAARLATLTTVCEGAEPSEAGYRIRLSVGNPTPARIDGIRLTLYAGPGAAQGRSDKRVHHEVATALPPGAWQTIDVDIAGLDAVSARELALRADAASIALAGHGVEASIRALR